MYGPGSKTLSRVVRLGSGGGPIQSLMGELRQASLYCVMGIGVVRPKSCGDASLPGVWIAKRRHRSHQVEFEFVLAVFARAIMKLVWLRSWLSASQFSIHW